jgi:hypothetical protein
MTKVCTVCKKEKEVCEFNKNSKRYDGLQSECRECAKERSKKYYLENKSKMIKQINQSRVDRLEIIRTKFFQYLKTCSCVDCGVNEPCVLDFDHKDSKSKTHEVSKMVHDGYSWVKILAEIKKCDVRCANCHRIKTAKDQGWYQNYYVK